VPRSKFFDQQSMRQSKCLKAPFCCNGQGAERAAEEWQLAWEEQSPWSEAVGWSALKMLCSLYVNPVGCGLRSRQPTLPVPLAVSLTISEVHLCLRLEDRPDSDISSRTLLQDSSVLIEAHEVQVKAHCVSFLCSCQHLSLHILLLLCPSASLDKIFRC
jgi:hypothetical protein